VDKKDRVLSMPDKQNYVSMRTNGQLSDLACLIPRAIFMKYKYRFNYAEDLDLGIRLIKEGHKIAFLSSIRVIHSHNRPTYYFLKRGYVDNIFLSDIFHDFPVSPIALHDFCKDVVFTYYVINSLVTEELLNMKTPCRIEELVKTVSDKFRSAVSYTHPTSINLAGNRYIDDEFKLFLEKLFAEHSVNGDNAPYKSVLMNSLAGLTNTTFEYIRESYETLDDSLFEDFKSCMFKTYSLLCGAHLAYCYKNSLNDGNEWLNEINVELTRGV